MALLDVKALAEHGTFKVRIKACICKAAIAIQGEDTGTTNHAERSALAYNVLHSPESYVGDFAWAVATQDAVLNEGTDVDDTTLYNTVSGLWNAFAVGGA
jgi:hypothetical protein